MRPSGLLANCEHGLGITTHCAACIRGGAAVDLRAGMSAAQVLRRAGYPDSWIHSLEIPPDTGRADANSWRRDDALTLTRFLNGEAHPYEVETWTGARVVRFPTTPPPLRKGPTMSEIAYTAVFTLPEDADESENAGTRGDLVSRLAELAEAMGGKVEIRPEHAPVFVATMETEHYRFTAVGETEDEARAAIVDGFSRHLIQGGVAAADLDTYADLNWGTGEGDGPLRFEEILQEWYGINVSEEIRAGECLRDGGVIPAGAPDEKPT